jgi:hypothetical protein
VAPVTETRIKKMPIPKPAFEAEVQPAFGGGMLECEVEVAGVVVLEIRLSVGLGRGGGPVVLEGSRILVLISVLTPFLAGNNTLEAHLSIICTTPLQTR